MLKPIFNKVKLVDICNSKNIQALDYINNNSDKLNLECIYNLCKNIFLNQDTNILNIIKQNLYKLNEYGYTYLASNPHPDAFDIIKQNL